MKKLLLLATLAVGGYVAYKKNSTVQKKVDDLIGIFKKGVRKGHEMVETKEVIDAEVTAS